MCRTHMLVNMNGKIEQLNLAQRKKFEGKFSYTPLKTQFSGKEAKKIVSASQEITPGLVEWARAQVEYKFLNLKAPEIKWVVGLLATPPFDLSPVLNIRPGVLAIRKQYTG